MNEKRSIPLYRQIIDWVILNIKNHTFLPGEKIPTELEIASQFQVSRGTVRLALNSLCKNQVLEAIRGSGYYVSQAQDVWDEIGQDYAWELLNTLVEDLRTRGFKDSDIQYCFRSYLAHMTSSCGYLHIIIAECNPDVYSVFHHQFRHIPNVSLDFCLLNPDFAPEDYEKLEHADMILTTQSHFKQILKARPELAEKTFRYNTTVSRETLCALADLPPSSRMGVFCQSPRFFQLVQNALYSMGFLSKQIVSCFPQGDVQQFLSGIDVLITPMDFPLANDPQIRRQIEDFRDCGKILVSFNYQIEKGSMIYIEERINHLINNGTFSADF